MNLKQVYVIAAAIVIASLIFGIFFYATRRNINMIRVVGHATSEFDTDIVKWNFTLTTMVPLDGLQNGYRQMKQKLDIFREIWEKMEIETEELNIQPVTINKNYGEYGKITGYNFEQNIYIVSHELDRIESIAIDPEPFTSRSIAFEYSSIQYFSSQLPEIKKELLGMATLDARKRAEEIVRSTDTSLGKMLSARAGVFQITEPYSTEVSGYGIYQTSTRRKMIRVTVTAEFQLK
ncbi:MAG: SIMPL domain-containing protein [Candidatus Cloacimonetes bacterium]|nr:SIMPL domain-containing protein [Candidatus Cloacimonadota bacterium]